MEPEGSSSHSQTHATCPYPEPAPSSPHTHFPLPEDPYLANSLAAAFSEPALYRLLTFHVPNLKSLFFWRACLLRDASSRNTPPPEFWAGK